MFYGDNDLSMVPGYETFKPLVGGWLSKLEAAKRAKAHWTEIADECTMFYSKSAAAMWSPTYDKKFWRNVKAPRFRITLNKAFEFVAVFGPNLLWDVPHRTVEPKRKLEVPQEFMQSLQQDPQAMQMLQMMLPAQQKSEATDNLVAYLMQSWLNYTPREQPKGGLVGQAELSVLDALIKGRGVTMTQPYRMPNSQQVLTGSFRERPEDLLIDPDFNTLDDARWIALKRVTPHWELERRFELPKDSLKNRASLESTWSYGEVGSMHRQEGQTNDLVVWYEIYSKCGAGARLSGMHLPVKEHLEEVIGDYAYLAIAPAVPFPLNCSSRSLQVGGSTGKGLSDDEVKQKFSWPIPYWADDRWPIEVIDFYPDPDNAWPVAPLAPGMGELKFLNFLVPWAANRIYSSSRDFWAVAGPHVEHYTKYLKDGEDQTVIPTPIGVQDVRQAIQVLTQPETRYDVWKIIEMVSTLFDKRVGLTEFAYGRNEDGTQNRTAEETLAKSRAVGVRPDHMRRKVVQWQSLIASLEGFCARWFVQGKDVEPLLGPFGKYLWENYVMSKDVSLVVREMKYTVAAASIRRPDRDRDVANFQQIMQIFSPVAQQYGFATGNYQPYNAMMMKWGELHDARMDAFQIPPPPPPPPAQPSPDEQLKLQQAQLDLQKTQLEIQGKQAELQGQGQIAQMKMVELAAKTQASQQQAAIQLQAAQGMTQLDLASQQQRQQLDAAAAMQDLQIAQAGAAQDLRQGQMAFGQDLAQDAIAFRQELDQKKKMAEVQRAVAAKPKPATPSKV